LCIIILPVVILIPEMAMPAKNVEQIKIWKTAHEWLKRLSDKYKAQGVSSASMTSLASQAILSLPEPTGNGHQPPADPALCEEGK
jgi:hypothetical protein